MRKAKLSPCYSKHYNMEAWGRKNFLVLSLTSFSSQTLLSFIISRAFGPHAHECVCMRVSGRKTPLIRCHVVLEAVTCQGSSRYLSVTTSLFSVCGWLGTVHLNTHICCSSMTWTTERSAVKMTLIVKHNKIQRRLRSFRTLWLHGQTFVLRNYHAAVETQRDKFKLVVMISEKLLISISMELPEKQTWSPSFEELPRRSPFSKR